MKRGDTVRIRIERLSTEGKGFACIEGRAVVIKGALPGDVADVRIMGLKRHSARVHLEGIVEQGVERVEAECPHFGRCGGCAWQDVPYGDQCRLKAGLVTDTLNTIPGIDYAGTVDCVPSPDIFFYRNKMEFSFDRSPGEERHAQLGLHETGRYDRVFDLERCLLQSDRSNRAVQTARDFAINHNLSVYGLKSHEGLLRFLMIRDGKNTGDFMVNVVTSGDDFPLAGAFAEHMAREIPETTAIVRSINRRTGSVAAGEEREVLRGKDMIEETIGGCAFRISPDSFFQTNTRQAFNLYNTIRSFCRPDGTQRLLDLYCGTGTIGIFCSDGVRTVTGVESVGDAVNDARMNAELNSAVNCTFIEGQVERFLDGCTGEFDVVVCDPPRAGIHPRAMNNLVRLRIPRMVYVSCNVKAMPADIELLAMAGYRVSEVRAFDMSPHTPHVETVVLLEL
ncbi:23S rRNA (uracil(1939)-C(5))-methyltransferase RlmD [bacterium]|nr:23S rRNA (uracil(1939)-C(5))-methyltransferase RlmD [bacterium]